MSSLFFCHDAGTCPVSGGVAELSVPGFYRDNRGDKGGRNNRRVLLNYKSP